MTIENGPSVPDITTPECVVIYHDNCMDGFTAAWAAWMYLGSSRTTYVPALYGQPAPDVRDKEVYIVDFSYDRHTLAAMKERALKLVVLDHHVTSQKELEGLDYAHFDMNRSGAGMTWDYFHSVRPWIVDYVEDRDLWRWKLLGSQAVNAFLSTEQRTFENWKRLYDETTFLDAMEAGNAVLAHIDQYVRDAAKNSYMVRFEDFDVPVVNASYPMISELVGHLAETAPFAIGWCRGEDKMFRYSLRSRGPDGVDVSAIAKKFGGGGHRNAAGFSLAELLF